MPRSGTLTSAERDSIRIDDFIFHIILKSEQKPITLSSVELEADQRKFFCDRIAEASEGTQYKFLDKGRGTAARCKVIFDDPAANFVKESAEIATDFRDFHSGNVSNGAFIVARFHIQTTGQLVPLIALIKLDHKKVIQYEVEIKDGKNVATMKEILNSFIESKAAVQKSATVDVGNYFTWDVLAQERGSGTEIADYFRNFLSVIEVENPTFWTEKAVATVAEWASSVPDLPEHKRNYRARAAQYMETHNEFDTDDFLKMVVMDGDRARKDRHMQELKAQLTASGVAGQKFPPAPSVVKKYKSSKVVTAEGVSIQWSGTDKAANVHIHDPDANGIITIEIKTQQLDDKSQT